jgi:hypothetical protein
MTTAANGHKSPPVSMLTWPPVQTDDASQPSSSATSFLWSRSTRYLCAAAHLDDFFWKTSLGRVYYQSNRAVAPSYGFALVPVLWHCLRARNMAIARDAAVAGTLLAGLCYAFPWFVWVAPAIGWVAIVVALGRVVRNAIRRVSSNFALTPLAGEFLRLLTVIITGTAITLVVGYFIYTATYPSLLALFRDAITSDPRLLLEHPPTVRGGGLLMCALAMLPIVEHRLWQQRQLSLLGPDRPVGEPKLTRRLKDIHIQQQGNTVLYSIGYPFVGSGELIHQGSLAGRLVRTRAGDQDGQKSTQDRPREFDRPPFTAEELFSYVADTLRPLATDARPERRIPGLTVTSRVFRTGAEVGKLSTETDLEGLARTIRVPTEPARHYLVCQVVSWYGELVTSVYVHFAVQGQALYLHMLTTALSPCNPRYRIIDHVDGTGPVAYLRALGRSLTEAPRAAATAPLRLVLTAADFLTESITRTAGMAYSTARGFRYGAWTSVRELGASKTPRDAMQKQDIDKYAQIVQRRVVTSMLDFLKERGVDTKEFDERADNYFNDFSKHYIGVWNSGSGSVNAENISGVQQNNFSGVGPQAGESGSPQPADVDD